MNNTAKISLTIELEGSTLVRKSEPEIIKYSVTKRDLEPNKKWKGKDGLEVLKKGVYKNYPLIAKPASQHINMSMEAYEYMTSGECPSWAKPKIWATMSKTQRLEAHLQRTCEHVGGKSFTYKILED